MQEGVFGIITELKYLDDHQEDTWMYYGIGLDGKSWQSISPTFIANNINDYIASLNK